MTPTCIITGGSGFLGTAVAALLEPKYRVIPLSFSARASGFHPTDLRDARAVRDLVTEWKPSVVVHTAAYRDPDFCERNPDETRRLNVEPVKVFCEALPPPSVFVYISTDYVFDGEHPPYREDSPVRPVSVYGQSKAEAEAVTRRRAGSVIVRTPLLIGGRHSVETSGYVGQLIAAARDKTPRALDDVSIRYPTWIRDVAAAVSFLLENGLAGTYHVSGPRGGTRYGLTVETAEILGESSAHLTASHEPIKTLARRPPNSHLDTGKLAAAGFRQFTDFAEVVRVVAGALGLV